MRMHAGLAALFAICLLDPGLALAQGLKHHLVVCSGDPDPVPGTGGNFTRFDEVDANSSGELAFLSLVDGGSSPEGVFVANPSVAPIAVAGQVAPGTSGGTFAFGRMGDVHIDEGGDVRFLADGLGVTVNYGIFEWSAGSLTNLVVQGDPAPGGGTYDALSGLAVSDDGSFFAFNGFGGTPPSVYTVDGGAHQLRIAPGDPSPVGPAYWSVSVLDVNDAGDVAFFAQLDTALPRPRGIFLDQNGTQTVIAMVGDPAPGTTGGTFTTFREVHLDAAGDLWFRADIEATSNPDRAIFHKPLGGSIVPIVMPGDPAPYGSGQIIDIHAGPVGNESGRLAFEAGVLGPNSGGYTGVYQYEAGQSTLAALNLWGAQGSKGGDLVDVGAPLAVAPSGAIAFAATIAGGDRCGIPYYGGGGEALYLTAPQSVPSIPPAYLAVLLLVLAVSGARLRAPSRRYGR